jgi:hypothetical protein
MTDTDMSVHRSPAVLTGVVSNYRGCADDLVNIAAILNRVDDDTPPIRDWMPFVSITPCQNAAPAESTFRIGSDECFGDETGVVYACPACSVNAGIGEATRKRSDQV